jgi:hypothetical protein
MSISPEIQGGNDFNSAQAANPTSGVPSEEEKNRQCAPNEKCRQEEGRKQCHLRPAGYMFVI